jgi:hypothetical protein
MKTYTVKRYLVEVYEVYADNKKSAELAACDKGDPHTIHVIKTTVKPKP